VGEVEVPEAGVGEGASRGMGRMGSGLGTWVLTGRPFRRYGDETRNSRSPALYNTIGWKIMWSGAAKEK